MLLFNYFKVNCVYRVLRADENPSVGIIAKQPDRNISLAKFLHDGCRVETQFIATTTSLETAKKHSREDSLSDEPLRIVKINLDKAAALNEDLKVYYCATKQAALQSMDISREEYVAHKRWYNVSAGQAESSNEVDIVGFISPAAIEEVF